MNTTTTLPSPSDIASLITELRSRGPIQRAQARRTLVEIGKASTPMLVDLLSDPVEHVRWEAAKALAGIADPEASPALIDAMDDDSADVRWVAGEAMIALGRDALRPLLLALIERCRSTQFCQSAHHVLSSLNHHQSDSLLSSVLEALNSDHPPMAVPLAAEAALENMRSLESSTRNGNGAPEKKG
jgi:HEAT repeat protein